MDISLLFKIAAIGILVAVLYQVLVRAGREDQAMMTTLAGLIIVLTLVIKEISTLFTSVRTMFGLWGGNNGYRQNYWGRSNCINYYSYFKAI